MRKRAISVLSRGFSSLIKAEKTGTFNCDQQTLFEIIDDTANYSKFVPWCSKSLVIAQRPDHYEVELEVGFKYFKDAYVSFVYPEPHVKVTSIAKDTQIFHLLESEWIFEPISDTQTRGIQKITFDFKSYFYQQFSEGFINTACDAIMSSFQERAEEITRIRGSLPVEDHSVDDGIDLASHVHNPREILRPPIQLDIPLEEENPGAIIKERNSYTFRKVKDIEKLWISIDEKIEALRQSGILKPKEMDTLNELKQVNVFRKKLEDIYRLYIIQVRNEAMFAMHLKDLCLQ